MCIGRHFTRKPLTILTILDIFSTHMTNQCKNFAITAVRDQLTIVEEGNDGLPYVVRIQRFAQWGMAREI